MEPSAGESRLPWSWRGSISRCSGVGKPVANPRRPPRYDTVLAKSHAALREPYRLERAILPTLRTLPPPPRRRPVALDRIDDLAVAALLALHVYRNDGVQRRHQQQYVKHEPEQQTRD